jgi:hypothetical protein
MPARTSRTRSHCHIRDSGNFQTPTVGHTMGRQNHAFGTFIRISVFLEVRSSSAAPRANPSNPRMHQLRRRLKRPPQTSVILSGPRGKRIGAVVRLWTRRGEAILGEDRMLELLRQVIVWADLTLVSPNGLSSRSQMCLDVDHQSEVIVWAPSSARRSMPHRHWSTACNRPPDHRRASETREVRHDQPRGHLIRIRTIN